MPSDYRRNVKISDKQLTYNTVITSEKNILKWWKWVMLKLGHITNDTKHAKYVI